MSNLTLRFNKLKSMEELEKKHESEAYWEKIIEKNKRDKERLVKERNKGNKSILRSYRIKI